MSCGEVTLAEILFMRRVYPRDLVCIAALYKKRFIQIIIYMAIY